MIDIKNAEKEFIRYTNQFDKDNIMIIRKIEHTHRVEENAKIIAEYLNLSEEQKQLAILIGLLHDIGRFEQAKRYNSFSDKLTIDHANLGVEILKTNNYISKYCDEKYWNTVLTAVENHNKLTIENGLSDEDLQQAKIIRDADKIDILNLYASDKIKDLYKITGTKLDGDKFISYEIIEKLKNKKSINKSMKKRIGDDFLCGIGFIYDVNYDISIKIIKDNNYVSMLFNKLKELCVLKEEKEWIKEAEKAVNQGIEERIKKYEENEK